jgi:hypothetical protein
LKTEPLISKELLTSSGSFGSILLVESIAKRVQSTRAMMQAPWSQPTSHVTKSPHLLTHSEPKRTLPRGKEARNLTFHNQ